jgi:protein involved in polysaccharide export with SLBB domain
MKPWLCILLPAFLSLTAMAELPVKPGDRLQISIAGVLESEMAQINRIYTVSAAGTIHLPHVQDVKATGKTPSELQKHIERTYIDAGIYEKPTFHVTTDVGRFVYIISGCNSNGPVAYTDQMTIFKAVSVAKGFSPYAQKHKVKLVRDGKSFALDLTQHTPQSDIPLLPDDQIVISE